MPADKKSTPNGTAKGKTPTNGTSTPVSVADTADTGITSSAKPDKATYDAEQARIKSEIDSLQLKLSGVRDKIGSSKNGSSSNERRTALRTELDTLKDSQATGKHSRTKMKDQIKTYVDGIEKKVKDLKAAKTKVPYKTVAEIDAHIKQLDKQVESGTMKLADEKRALQEISQCRRNRKTVEAFQADQESIDADNRAIAELKAQLDDPESKATQARYDEIKAELDEIKKESDVAYAGRNKLFEERDNIQAELNVLFNQKRELASKNKEANDRYWSKVHEDRARRQERLRVQRTAEEAQKKKEIAERLREEAEIPAYQADIEDCQTLIDYLTGTTSEPPTFKALVPKQDVAGVAKLEIRKVEDAIPEGGIIRKKKGEDEESYFVGGAKGKKGKKPPTKAGAAATEPPASATRNLPFATLSALLGLSIPPPASPADFPRVVEDLKTKKTWFEANQARVTADNVAKAEAEIKRLTVAAEAASEASQAPQNDEAPVEKVAEPVAQES